MVVFTSDDPALDLFVLADELAARGWHTQPQLAYAGPAPVDPPHRDRRGRAAGRPRSAPDLPDAVAAARAQGPVVLDADLVELVAALTPEQLTPDTVAALAGALGFSLGRAATPLPDRRATINTLVEAAPAPVREALFGAFLSLLQRPTYS